MERVSRVKLIPAGLEDRIKVFEWFANSDLTTSMIGPPDFPDHPIPTWEEFCEDYVEYYFDGTEPYKGRSFLINCSNDIAGHINYAYDFDQKVAELDIWLKDSSYVTKGIGSAAIAQLVEYLVEELKIHSFLIRPSARNERAIRAYEKAGFSRAEMSKDEIISEFGEGDYEDEVVLIKQV